MRRVRYSVAASLDGYIAGPGGEFDWITIDPGIDFGALNKQFDAALIGRKTYELMLAHGSPGGMPGMKNYVFSRTLSTREHPKVTVCEDAAAVVAELRAASGKDIWLVGGGILFRTLLERGVVDLIEVKVIPILLGAGIPLLPSPAQRAKLKLTDSKALPSGIVLLSYSIDQS